MKKGKWYYYKAGAEDDNTEYFFVWKDAIKDRDEYADLYAIYSNNVYIRDKYSGGIQRLYKYLSEETLSIAFYVEGLEEIIPIPEDIMAEIAIMEVL